MGATGYLMILLGGLLIRQVVVGRVTETPSDIRDLFVAVITADTDSAGEVLSRRGTNVSDGVVGTSELVATDADNLVTGPINGIGAKAIDYGNRLAQSGRDGFHGRCLAFVQECYSQGAHVPQQSRGDAANAWAMAKFKHEGAPFASIPPGVPVFWSGGNGHVVLSTGGGGCLSTDHPLDDVANVTTLAEIDKWLGGSHPYEGWSEDSCGTRVWGKGTGKGAANG
jgi:hypothetical protein